MEEWKVVRLGDYVAIKSGLAYKSIYIGKGNNLLLGMGCVSFKEKFLDTGARPYLEGSDSRYHVHPGDIVLATRQQSDNLPILAMPAYIPDKFFGKTVIFGTNLYKVENNSEIENRFLFWLLKTPDYINYIASIQSGTTVRMVTKKNIEDYVFKLPPKYIRDEISNILWGLDDKIENNRRINENLEQQAQALFKSWFVDFEPFKDGKYVESELGLIPEGWRVGTLGDICQCLLGGTPSRNIDKYWNGDIAWINSGEVNKFRITKASEYITEEGLNKSATKLLPPKTTVLAITGATLGQVSLLEIATCANQSVIGILENNDYSYEFIFPLIKDKINDLISNQTGGAQQHINKNNVEQLKIIIPPKKVLLEFKRILSPIYDKIGKLCFENDNLATLRDNLLPRLMSGELKVKEI